jgi:hypothetical protein
MYKTINGWTKESMIAHVRVNFKGKGVKPDDSGDSYCVYRGPNRAKCAVGMFIPDELYDPKMDSGHSVAVSDLLALEPRLKNVMPLEVLELRSLQLFHDRSRPENTLANMIKWIENNVA